MALPSESWFWGKHFIWYCSGAQRIYKFFRHFLKHSLKFWVLLFTLHWGLHTVQYTLGSFLHFQLMMWRLSDSQRGRVAKFCFHPGIVPGGRPFLAGDRMAGPQGWLTVKKRGQSFGVGCPRLAIPPAAGARHIDIPKAWPDLPSMLHHYDN